MFMETITNTNWQNKPTRQQNRKYWLFSVLFAGSGRRFNIQTARKNLSHWKSGPFSSDYLRENFQYFDRSGYIKFSWSDVLLNNLPDSARWLAVMFGRWRPSARVRGDVEWEYFSNNIGHFQCGVVWGSRNKQFRLDAHCCSFKPAVC